MKKLAVILIIILCFTLLVGCTKEAETASKEPSWKISIEGVKASAIEFTDLDVEKIGTVEVTATLKKKDDSESKQTWTGVTLKSVLEYVEVKEYSQVIVEAGDGYSKEYSADLVESDGTVLSVKVDGKDLTEEDGLVYLVVDGASGNMWIKNVAKIIIEK